MPTFDGKSEKFELFENLFQTSLKNHDKYTDQDKTNYFHSLMRGDGAAAVQKHQQPKQKESRENYCVPLEKLETPVNGYGKIHFSTIILQSSEPQVNWSAGRSPEIGKNAFNVAAQAIIEQFIYAKMTLNLMKSINQAHSEHGPFEQTVTHIKRVIRAKQFGSSWWVSHQHCDAKFTNWWQQI